MKYRTRNECWFKLIYLKTIISPWTKFHETCLLIEWKISYINFTRWFENSWWCPINFSSIMKYSFCQCCHNIFTVSAAYYKFKYDKSVSWKNKNLQHNRRIESIIKKKKRNNKTFSVHSLDILFNYELTYYKIHIKSFIWSICFSGFLIQRCYHE